MDVEIFKNVATVVGCGISCITFLSLIIKPIRNKIANAIASKVHNKEREQLIDDIKEQLDKSLKNDENIMDRLDKVEKRVLGNESDRLKSELFTCGNRCRRDIKLYPEEFEHIRNVYHKYNEELGQNHDGTQEWEFIYDYYNHQSLD